MSTPGSTPARSLVVSERLTMRVEARSYWTDTGLEIVEDAVYECHANGRWLDMLIVCGTDDYDTPWWSLGQRLLAGTRRLPTAPWFALCGAVPACGAGPFLIGANARLRLPAGRMLCFANDVPGFYWNNFGAVTLTVERVHAADPEGSV
jgi:hypothetical protein